MASETELERMVIRLIGDARSYQRMLKNAERSTVRFGKRIGQRSVALVGRIAKVGIAGATVAAGVLGALSIKEFAGFETALSRMEGLVGLSKETVKGFSVEILRLAGTTSKAPIELAEAMFFITSAGLRGKAALEALEQSAKASAAGMGETSSVADAVTSAMNAYGPSVLNATKATEVLTAAVREGKAEASTFAPVLGQVLPTANELGVSFDQAAGTIAFLTKSTGSASLAATGLRGILAKIAQSTPQTETALKKIGLTIGGVRKSIKEDGLLATLVDLRKRFEAQGMPISKMFTDIEGLNAVLQLTGNQSDSAAQTIKNVGDSVGIVDDAFKSASDTIGFKWSQIVATAKIRLIEFGQSAAPAIGKILDSVQSLLESAKGLGSVFTQMANVVGAVFGLISNSISSFEKNTSNVFKAIKDSVLDFLITAEFVFNNFGEFGALAMLKVQLAFVQFSGEVSHFFTGVLPSLFSWFTTNWQDIFLTAFDFATTVMINWGGNVRTLFGNLMKFITGELEGGLTQGFTGLLDGFKNTIKEIPDIPKREISVLEDNLDTAVKNIEGRLGGKLADLREKRMKELLPAEDAAKALDDAQKPAEEIGKSLGNTIGTEASKAIGTAIRVDAVAAGSVEALSRITSTREDAKLQMQAAGGNTGQTTAQKDSKSLGNIDTNSKETAVLLQELIDKQPEFAEAGLAGMTT